MKVNEIKEKLHEGYSLESDDGRLFVTEENMTGGKYCCWAIDEYGCKGPVKLTNSIKVIIAFVS